MDAIVVKELMCLGSYLQLSTFKYLKNLCNCEIFHNANWLLQSFWRLMFQLLSVLIILNNEDLTDLLWEQMAYQFFYTRGSLHQYIHVPQFASGYLC